MSALEEMLESEVQNSEIINDYLQIHFTNGSILNVYNSYIVRRGRLTEIKGKKLCAVLESDIKLELVFCDSLTIAVDLTSEAYNGPEAMQLIRDGHPTIIWN